MTGREEQFRREAIRDYFDTPKLCKCGVPLRTWEETAGICEGCADDEDATAVNRMAHGVEVKPKARPASGMVYIAKGVE